MTSGLFQASYLIGESKPGAVQFTIHLGVYTPGQTLSGMGHITQATNPPLDIPTKLQGQYKEVPLSLRVPTKIIFITATGYPIIKWPDRAGTGPAIPSNAELTMTLSTWESGTASFKYTDAHGETHEVESVPAKLIGSDQSNGA